MREIIRQKSGMIGKLFVYQFAMSLLGLFVVSPFKGNMLIFASLFASLFYFSLVGYAVIEDGQKDCVSHNAGRINGSPMTGFVYSLVSYIPTIIVVLIQVILQFVTSPAQLQGLKSVLTFIIRFFLMGMYLGFDSGLVWRGYDKVTQSSVVLKGSDALVFMSDKYLIFAICLVFLPLVSGIVYYLAFNGKVHVNTAPKEKKGNKK
ncbi:MAG: hypothetical protein E7600_05975 [Ruminococcaceae bacterium]|nr:hypothetical protein [Oscillospiraceae bacterium]